VLRGERPGLTKAAGTTPDGLSAVTGPLTPEDGQKVKRVLERFTAAAGTAGAVLKAPPFGMLRSGWPA
jgi:phospholipid/cholesterol/gamma-HCH transport system substrate-binding protein